MSDPVVLLSTGDVVGPAGGVTDNSMVLFSGTSGKLIKGNNAVVTAAGLALLDDVNAAAQMVTLGLTATATELNYTDGVTSAIQTQLNGKAPLTGAGASGTWGINVTGNAAGNAATATTLSGDQSNWESIRSNAVANMLGWKNYGNGHVIFDASKSTSPSGSAVNSTNATTPWSATYPTLMGWNGSTTYGVRVDSARVADSLTASPALTGVPTAPTPASGTRSTAIATMQNFANEFGSSFAPSGYQKLPSGLIVQWGAIPAVAAGGSVLVNYPIAFPNAVFSIPVGSGASNAGVAPVNVQGVSAAQFRAWSSSNTLATQASSFFAIGW